MALNLKSLPINPRMPIMNNRLENKSAKSLKALPPPKSESKKQKRGQKTQVSIDTSIQPPSDDGSSSFTAFSMPDQHRLLATGDFSDCTLVACGREFKLHKAVICYASVFFMKALTSQMREGLEGKVILPQETELDDVTRMIKFMYEKDYRQDKKPTTRTFESCLHPSHVEMLQETLDDLWLDVRMYSLGKRYLVDDLMRHSLQSFLIGLDSEVLFPAYVQRLEQANSLRFIVNEPNTVPSILELARRTYLHGEDLDEKHKEAMFELIFKLYPCLCKFKEFRDALKTDLSQIAGEILLRVTPPRTERLVEHCTGCQNPLLEEAALEFCSYCRSCKMTRRMEDYHIDNLARLDAGRLLTAQAHS